MRRKRATGSVDRGTRKKPRKRTSGREKLSDFDFISEHDYVTVGDLMYVRPYVFEFKTHFKPRWRNQTVHHVFCQEFRHAEPKYWTKEFEEGRILSEGQPIHGSVIWQDGMEVTHIIHRHESAVLSEKVHICEDHEGYVVVSKPPSFPIHPCGTYRRNCLQFILKSFYGLGKLHAVHRLDKETSGLVIFAKSPDYAARFSAEIKDHKVSKKYLAEVQGIVPWEVAESQDPIYWDKRNLRACIRSDGAEAATSFRRIYVNFERGTSILECHPRTGRTHQIRIHLATLGYPIVNDSMYSERNPKRSHRNKTYNLDQEPDKLTLSHPVFEDEASVNKLRTTYMASEWSKSAMNGLEQPLTCMAEGHALSCTNCPQVTNVKNVPVNEMFIHLHALKYESQNWSFEVPPPTWAIEKQNAPSGKRFGCTLS